MSSYYIDLSGITLSEFRKSLEEIELMPGRRVLQDNIRDHFHALEATGIHTMHDLVSALSTKKKTETLASQTDIPVDYLVILGREARSRQPNPVPLEKIPGVNQKELAALAENKIKNSKQLFDAAACKSDRTVLAKKTGISEEHLQMWVLLSDFARITGVGPVFIRILAEAGVHSVAEMARMNAGTLFTMVKETYTNLGYTNANFTVKDMAMCIDIAAQLPHTVEE